MEDVTPQAKPCRKCGELRPLDDFYKSKTGKYGRTSRCKPCVLAEMAERYARDMADPGRASRRKAQMKVASRRRYLALDAEGLRKQREMTADWRSRSKEATAEQYRKWRIANAQRVLEKNHRRRARLLGAFVAPVDPTAIWERDGGVCQLCMEPINASLEWPDRMSRTMDHIVPLVKGGTHEPANIQLAHAVCNSIKGDRAA